MRAKRFFAVPVLISLVSIGCSGGDLGPDETEGPFDRSLLAQDESGEFFAPVTAEAESSATRGELPQAYYTMHNHHLPWMDSGSVSYWQIHGGPASPDSPSCAPLASHQSVCSNIAVYVGGTVGQLVGSFNNVGCASNFYRETHCKVW